MSKSSLTPAVQTSRVTYTTLLVRLRLRTIFSSPSVRSHRKDPPLGQQQTQWAPARVVGADVSDFPGLAAQQLLEPALPFRRPTLLAEAGHGAEHAQDASAHNGKLSKGVCLRSRVYVHSGVVFAFPRVLVRIYSDFAFDICDHHHRHHYTAHPHDHNHTYIEPHEQYVRALICCLPSLLATCRV